MGQDKLELNVKDGERSEKKKRRLCNYLFLFKTKSSVM